MNNKNNENMRFQTFRQISEDRITYIGNSDGEMIEPLSAETYIHASNEEDRKTLERIYGLR